MKIQISDVKGVLSKEPGISLYYQVEKYLSDKIRSGEWRVGDQIPTEQELSEKLKVSRATVRQAFQQLAQKGMLERKHGAGTFVASPAQPEEFISLTYPKELGGRHLLIDNHLEPCTSYMSQYLGVPVGTIVGVNRQLRVFDDDTIAAIENRYVNLEFGSLPEDAETMGTFAEYMRQRLKVDFTCVRSILEPVLLTEEEAKLLKEKKGDPALMVIRVYCTYQDKPVYVTKNITRASICKYLIIR